MWTVNGDLTTAPALEVFIEGIYKMLLMALSKDAQRSCIIRIQQPCSWFLLYRQLCSQILAQLHYFPLWAMPIFLLFSEAIAGCHFPD